MNYTSYDIKGKTEAEISKTLDNHDIIHMEGGNTFYILKTIQETNFETILREKLNNGLNYIGTSAGSYVVTPSIITATWNDRGFDRCGLEDFAGMNFVPFVLKAHYTNERKETILNNTKDLRWPLRILNDYQAFAVNNQEVKFIGKGEEITLDQLQNE